MRDAFGVLIICSSSLMPSVFSRRKMAQTKPLPRDAERSFYLVVDASESEHGLSNFHSCVPGPSMGVPEPPSHAQLTTSPLFAPSQSQDQSGKHCKHLGPALISGSVATSDALPARTISWRAATLPDLCRPFFHDTFTTTSGPHSSTGYRAFPICLTNTYSNKFHSGPR